MPEPRPEKRPDGGPDRMTRHVGAGLTLAASVGLFSWGGHMLDQRLSTSPMFLLLGLALGAAGGFLHLVKVIAPELLPFRKLGRQGRERDDATDDLDRPSE